MMFTNTGAVESCPDCGGKGIIVDPSGTGARKCRCLVGSYVYRRVGSRFFPFDLPSMEAHTPSQVECLKSIRENPGGSYYLYGNNRTGKTTIAAALFHTRARDAKEKFHSVRWWTEPDLRTMLLFGNVSGPALTEGNEPSVVEQVTDAIMEGDLRAIFIDDIGKVKVTAATRQAFYAFVNTLYNFSEHVQLVITSEFSLKDLAGVSVEGELSYGRAIPARLADICAPVNLQGSEPFRKPNTCSEKLT